MESKTVTLSNGAQVKVVPVPPYAVLAAQAVVPLPEPPMNRGVSKTADGREEPFAVPIRDADNPEYKQYLRDKDAAEKKRNSIFVEIMLLMGLDITIPDNDWFAPLAYVGVKPREGDVGRKLDYIQYCLLASDKDLTAVIDAINDITYVREERIQSIEESFRRNGERDAAGSVVSGSATEESKEIPNREA